MKRAELLETYSRALGNAISISANSTEVLRGINQAMVYMRGSADHAFYFFMNEVDRAWRTKFVQVFEYEGQIIAYDDNTWRTYVLDIPTGWSWHSTRDLNEKIQKDDNLRDKLRPRELYICLKTKYLIYNPAEDILLGREPDLKLFRDLSPSPVAQDE